MGEYPVSVFLDGDGKLVLEADIEHPLVGRELIPAGGTKIGVVLMDSKNNLAVHHDAVPFLRRLFEDAGCDGDGFGDIDWFQVANGQLIFSWLGPNRIEIDPSIFSKLDKAQGARFREDGFVTITTKLLTEESSN